jgi:superoxide dismutase
VKADYFDAVWNVVNWNDVAGKLKEAQQTKWSP